MYSDSYGKKRLRMKAQDQEYKDDQDDFDVESDAASQVNEVSTASYFIFECHAHL